MKILLISHALWLLFALGLSGCNLLPRDPFNSLNKAHERGFLRVGISASPPWINHKDGDVPTGIEADILMDFSQSHTLPIKWTWSGAEENFQSLKDYELDIAVGNFSKSNPWKEEIGFTTTYFTEFFGPDSDEKEHVMAAAPGENHLITTLESFLLSIDQKEIRDRLKKDGRK